MSYENTTLTAETMFKELCTALDNRNWKYERDDDMLKASFAVSGEDIPMDFVAFVDKKLPFIQIFSKLPVSVPEDKRVEMAVAVAAANWGSTNGCFQFDISDGDIIFKVTQCFVDSILGEDCIQYLISLACSMVDHYNDRFFALVKDVLSLSDFIAKEN